MHRFLMAEPSVFFKDTHIHTVAKTLPLFSFLFCLKFFLNEYLNPEHLDRCLKGLHVC